MLTFLINNLSSAEREVPCSVSGGPLIFNFFFPFFNSNKKMIEILTKIRAKITIIILKNREPYYFIIIYKCKKVTLPLFSYQMLASTFDSDERSSYYKVCVVALSLDAVLRVSDMTPLGSEARMVGKNTRRK